MPKSFRHGSILRLTKEFTTCQYQLRVNDCHVLLLMICFGLATTTIICHLCVCVGGGGGGRVRYMCWEMIIIVFSTIVLNLVDYALKLFHL